MLNKIKNNAFFRNTLILFAGTMVAGIINYFFHFTIGRMVSVRVFGEVESLVALMGIVSVPSAAITMAATRYGAILKSENNGAGNAEVIKFFYRKMAGYGLPVFVFLLAATPWIGRFFKIENIFPFVIIWIIMFLSFFSSVNGGIINGWQKFKESSVAGILGAIAKISSAVILIKAGFELTGAVGGFAIGAIVSYVGTFYILKSIKKTEKKAADVSKTAVDFKSIKSYLIAATIGSLAITVLGNADMILAKHNLGAVQAGQYGALTVASKIIFFITGIIATVLFSMSAEEAHKKDGSLKTLKISVLAMAAVSVAAVAAYFIFPGFILGTLFGNKYLEITGYLGWFALFAALFSFANLLFQYLLSVHDITIAYILPVIAIVFSASVLVFAQNIRAILILSILAQVLAIFSGIYCLIRLPDQTRKIPR